MGKFVLIRHMWEGYQDGKCRLKRAGTNNLKILIKYTGIMLKNIKIVVRGK